jgi:putative transposase
VPSKQQYELNRTETSCTLANIASFSVRNIVARYCDDAIAVRRKEIIHGVAADAESEVIELEVMPDHVHLLCEVDPQFGIATFVRLVKGRSSHALRSEFPKLKRRLPALWTNSWFRSTAGAAPLAIVKQYTENPKNR